MTSETIYECANCAKHWPETKLEPVKDMYERVEEGEEEPDGECPECGALCYPVEG